MKQAGKLERARLTFRGGQYDVTPDDVMWLLRAVQAEGPVRTEVACALVNLFAYLRGTGKWSKTLGQLVRAYAQPVNPRWFVGGDLYEKSLEGVSDSERAKLRIKAESRVLHSARTVFTSATHDAVKHALAGPYRGDVTDYAAPRIDASRKGYAPRSAVIAGRNRLWTRAVGWAGYAVDSAWGTPGTGGGGALVALVVVGVWYVFKRG